jgi:TctA family transporter
MYKNMIKDISFLSSRRFWALIVIAIVGVLGQEGILSSEIVAGLITILGGFVGIRTIDKFSETVK